MARRMKLADQRRKAIDACVAAFHERYRCPTPADTAVWIARYPEFDEDIEIAADMALEGEIQTCSEKPLPRAEIDALIAKADKLVAAFRARVGDRDP